MKCELFAPSYYGEFECIKGECRHSCCIGWEIDIDDTTMGRYASVGGDIGDSIRKSIFVPKLNERDKAENEDGEDFDSSDFNGASHFVLTAGDRCPHLDGCGLCRIITELGEGYLSDICRLHPRFFNETARGREVGLGMSCEEACRIILSSDGYADFAKIGDDECDIPDFDVIPYRDALYSILSDRGVPYTERLSRISERFSVSPALLSDGERSEEHTSELQSPS